MKRFHPDTRFLDLSKRRALDGIFAALEKANLVVDGLPGRVHRPVY
ncbi:MAG: hypothetical protein V9H26_12745 [Verrucomicrobiota bacterium]